MNTTFLLRLWILIHYEKKLGIFSRITWAWEFFLGRGNFGIFKMGCCYLFWELCLAKLCHFCIRNASLGLVIHSAFALGNLIFYQHLTDSPQNQHVVLLVLQNLKSKISEESDQNWRCYSSALLGLRATKFGRPAVLGWMNLFLACSNFSFHLISLKFWIYQF